MTVSLTFSECVCLLISRGLSVSVSPRLCVCLSLSRFLVFRRLCLSHASPRPQLLQWASPSWPRTRHPHFPGASRLGSSLRSEATAGKGVGGGLGLAAATFARTVPFAPAASGSVGLGIRWGEGGPEAISGWIRWVRGAPPPPPGGRPLGAPRLGRTLVLPLRDPSTSK